ncbi:MAG TPA: replicative helicase loader/inhibitor [Gaiellaceae bacterium]
MTREQAAGLFALLRAAHPRTVPPDKTADLWLDELGRLDHDIAEPAVRAVIATVRTWPAIAHLNEQVAVIRERQHRDQREAERLEEQLADESMPRPPLLEIPAAVELAERWNLPLAEQAAALRRGERDTDPDEGWDAW